MTKSKANKIIHEAMGKCWHKADPHNLDECLKCKSAAQNEWYDPIPCESLNPDYHTPEGFVACWNWAKKQGWWDSFVYWYAAYELVNPETFATVLAEYLGGENDHHHQIRP